MKNLILKEFKLSIHYYFYIMPLLTGALLLIPQWFYFISLMYFIFIGIPNIFGAFNAQNDYIFTSLLPVNKYQIVLSKHIAIMLLQLYNIVIALIFAFIHNKIYSYDNFSLDLNNAFFGLSFIMYSLFNIIFFPLYFKTAYKFGLPLIWGILLILIFIGVIEYSVITNNSVKLLLEGKSITESNIQLLILIGGIIIFCLSGYISSKLSLKNFKKVEL